MLGLRASQGPGALLLLSTTCFVKKIFIVLINVTHARLVNSIWVLFE